MPRRPAFKGHAAQMKMQLVFPNGEHPGAVVDASMLSIGRAGGNTLALADASVAPWHARITADSRGLVLDVLDNQARTHVNARPVLEAALLRAGDQVSLGSVTMQIRSATHKLDHTGVVADETPQDIPPPAQGTVVLRGMSGEHFGQSLAVADRLHIGTAAGCGIRLEGVVDALHAVIETTGEVVRVRMLAGDCHINGIRCQHGLLFAGDQLVLCNSHRFILEAPGLPSREQLQRKLDDRALAQQPGAAVMQEDATVTDPGVAAVERSSVWWLIGIAALISAALAALLWIGR